MKCSDQKLCTYIVLDTSAVKNVSHFPTLPVDSVFVVTPEVADELDPTPFKNKLTNLFLETKPARQSTVDALVAFLCREQPALHTLLSLPDLTLAALCIDLVETLILSDEQMASLNLDDSRTFVDKLLERADGIWASDKEAVRNSSWLDRCLLLTADKPLLALAVLLGLHSAAPRKNHALSTKDLFVRNSVCGDDDQDLLFCRSCYHEQPVVGNFFCDQCGNPNLARLVPAEVSAVRRVLQNKGGATDLAIWNRRMSWRSRPISVKKGEVPMRCKEVWERAKLVAVRNKRKEPKVYLRTKSLEKHRYLQNLKKK